MKKFNLFSVFTILILMGLFYTSSVSAQVYVKFGDIKGDVRDKGHDEWTECNSIQFGVANPKDMGTGSVRQRSQAQMSEVVLSKLFDKSSVKLMEAATLGTVFPTVEIHLVRNSRSGMTTYLTVKLTNAALSSYNISSGGQRPEESVAVAYEEIEFTHSLIDENGREAGKIPFKWKLEQNRR